MENLNSRGLLESIREQKIERQTYSLYLGPVWLEFKALIEADNEEAGKKKVSPSEALEALMEMFLADFKKRKK